MNKILWGVAGAAFGAYIGWAVTADYYEKRLRDKDQNIDILRNRPIGKILSVDRTDEGISVTGELFRDINTTFDSIEEKVETIDYLASQLEDARDGISPEEDTTEDDVTGETDEERQILSEDPETTRANLQKLIDSYTNNPDDVDVFVNRAETMDHVTTPPFVISREKYSWDEEEGDEYDKITVTYYPRERVVLDDDDDPIEDVANTLGWKNLSQFGGESGDMDVVFIRNRRMRVDFEVVREEEQPLPLHVKYGMGREEFEVNKAAGTLRLREEDQ